MCLPVAPQCDLNPWKLPVDGESLEPATDAISWGDLAELQAGTYAGLPDNLVDQRILGNKNRHARSTHGDGNQTKETK